MSCFKKDYFTVRLSTPECAFFSQRAWNYNTGRIISHNNICFSKVSLYVMPYAYAYAIAFSFLENIQYNHAR